MNLLDILAKLSSYYIIEIIQSDCYRRLHSSSENPHQTSDQYHILNTMASARPIYSSRLLRGYPVPRALPIRQQSRWQSTPSAGQSHQAQPPPDLSEEATRTTGASDPPAPRTGDSGMIRQEGAEGALVRHHPDFHAPVDHGTSWVATIEYAEVTDRAEIRSGPSLRSQSG